MSDPERGSPVGSESDGSGEATTVRPSPAAVPREAPPKDEALDDTLTRTPSPSAPAPGQLLAGRYTILDLLGRGGMGVVLAAYDARLDRRVALKLLRPQEGLVEGDERRARQLREAHAMARLSHPHVVSIYDAGTLEDGSVFIAMEMVEGQTLRRWCEGASRSWREVLDSYLAAGRGLAAAHAAGIIHRDFKPDNVLVGRDGRVRVTDFGLARVDSSPALQDPAAGPAPAEPWDSSLTLPGTLLGTPRYMAPEQLRGHPADARSDLYAFCLALYEALYGKPPFVGHDLGELTRARLENQVEPPPARSEVPAWVARALLRGLRAEPHERPSSLEELLRELGRDPLAARRRRLQALAALLGVLVLGTWVGLSPSVPSPCRGAERKLAGLWDAPRRAAIHRAFTDTGTPFAERAWRGVEQELNHYARDWLAQHQEACEATRVHGEQSEQVLTLRMRCLERRLKDFAALGNVFAQADAQVVERALGAAQALPPLAQCMELEGLSQRELLPEAPEVRARVEELQGRLAQARALVEAGRYEPGRVEATAVSEAASATGHAPLEAEAWLLLAQIHLWREDLSSAAQGADRAVRAALTSQRPELQGQAWLVLLKSLRGHGASPQEVERLVGYVQSAIVAAGSPPSLRFELEDGLAMLYNNYLMNPARGLEHARRALVLAETQHGPEHLQVAEALYQLAMAHLFLGQPTRAVEAIRRCLDIRRKSLGPEHPQVALTLNALANYLAGTGQLPEALAAAEQARALYEHSIQDTAAQALTLDTLALLHLLLRQPAEATRHIEHALSLADWRRNGPGWLHASLLSRLAQCRFRQGQLAPALEMARQAQAEAEQAHGAGHPALAPYLTLTGELELALGHSSVALTLLERALKSSGEDLHHPEETGRTRFALARALWKSGGDRLRARALLAQAKGDFDRAGALAHLGLAEWRDWVRAHEVEVPALPAVGLGTGP